MDPDIEHHDFVGGMAGEKILLQVHVLLDVDGCAFQTVESKDEESAHAPQRA